MRRFLHVPTIYVLSKNMKIVQKIQLKIVIFTAMKNRCILHGRVFVMLVQQLARRLGLECRVFGLLCSEQLRH